MKNLYATIDNVERVTIDDVPVETKNDFFGKVEEIEMREIDVKVVLNYLRDTLTFFTNINITGDINIRILDLLADALEESTKSLLDEKEK
ncbi:MAG: hypothetical protein PHO63_03010 [Bacilli bacterium]|nr:hypothetical protein [Bacilli bacterium]MDD4809220.1 hypothetical protein [Bacilli bacterium]